MEQYAVKIIFIEKITHNVLRIVTEKPENYNFHPGQATEISINKEGWVNEKRPFTFTSLPEDNFLEFTIKTYPERSGVTNQLLSLKKDDELLLHEVFGAIEYKGEGVFIAGGAGVTPFISIFRYLDSKHALGNNKLIFANKTKSDIIHEDLFKNLLGKNFINILSEEKNDEYANGQLTEEFIRNNSGGTEQLFYLCGPPPMMDAVEKFLENMKVDKKQIVHEAF
jgi:ferredoxin-NADP reductase